MAKRRRLTRRLVVEQAAALADAAADPAAVSLAALAAALEIRVPSLYNHIDGQADLLQALAVVGLEQLLADLRAAVDGRVGREALWAAAAAYRRFAHTHPGLYPLTLQAPAAGGETGRLSAELVQLLRLILASVGIQGEAAIHAIRAFRALVHGFVSLEIAGGFDLPASREESFHLLLGTYLDGLLQTSVGR